MKTKLHSGFIALACTGLLAMSATAQTFTTLHSFTALDPNYGTNTDGVNPWGGVVLSGNTLYGTTFNGGGAASNRGYGGTAFRVNTDGTHFTNLHNFSYSPTNSYEPYDGMILSGSTLYGTSWDGGSNGLGTVFKVNTDGTGFTNLYNFAGYYYNDGAEPYGDWCWRATRYMGRRIKAVRISRARCLHQHRWHGLHQPSHFRR